MSDKANREKGREVVDNLNRSAWKLQGIAGLFFIDDTGDKVLNHAEVTGLSFLLDQIAKDILVNTEHVERML